MRRLANMATGAAPFSNWRRQGRGIAMNAEPAFSGEPPGGLETKTNFAFERVFCPWAPHPGSAVWVSTGGTFPAAPAGLALHDSPGRPAECPAGEGPPFWA